MNVKLAYGQGTLTIEFPEARTTVITPATTPGLPDEQGAVLAALRQPIGAAPLREWIRPDNRVVIAFTDITRATPNQKLIPWLLEHLEGVVARENVLLLNGTGTHRPNTPAELEGLLTRQVVERYRVVNNDPHDRAAHVELGVTRGGAPALLNRHLIEADVRIITGFIEPHFFAGFSGGPKGIMPGLSHLETVGSNHGVGLIADPQAAFGVTIGNPIWEEMRDIALRVGPSFLLNVTLNEQRQITGVFAGDLIAAHQVGCEFCRCSAMQPVAQLFDLVVTTNSGYPLDLNLYQGVKGMAAAARIVKPGGTIILAAECREGLPTGSPHEQLLRSVTGPEALLAWLEQPGAAWPEQWQSQIQALIQRRATVLVHSSLPEEAVRAAHLEPCPDIAAAVRERLAEAGPEARVAVLPQGPLTIPYTILKV